MRTCEHPRASVSAISLISFTAMLAAFIVACIRSHVDPPTLILATIWEGWLVGVCVGNPVTFIYAAVKHRRCPIQGTLW